MDTFDTSEEVISEIDIEATEVDFGENFEHGVNDQEHENNNEQEAGIGGENGERSIEDEKPEEKEETLSEFISANRGGSEEFKLEYEGTFVLSTLTEEQKTAQADLLTTLTANPEQSMMLPDHVEGKTTYFTAAKMDNEGNLKYEIRSFTQKEEEKEEQPINRVEGTRLEEATLNLELSIDIDKQEEVDKETLVSQSLLTEVEAVSEEDAEQAQEITQGEEQSFSIPEVQHADVEQVISIEETQSGFPPVGEYANIDNTHYGEQVVIETKEDTEKVITERIIDLLKEEPQAEFIEEASTVVGITETEQSLKDTNEHHSESGVVSSEPLVVTVEAKTEKVLTLEDRIRELFRDEVQPTEIMSEQMQTFEVQNAQQEEVVADVNKTTEINITTETVTEAEITLPSTRNTEISEPVVNEILITTTERSVISNEQVEEVVVNMKDIENLTEIHETVQVSHIESIKEQSTEQVEQIFTTERIEVDIVEEKPEEVVLVNEQESKVLSTIEQTVTKEVTTDIQIKAVEHVITEQTHTEKTGIVSQNNESKENIITKSEEKILNVSTVPLNVTEIKSEEATVERIVEITEDKHITSHEVEISKPLVTEMIDGSKETSVNSNQEVEKVVNMIETTERNSTTEAIKAEEDVIEKVQSSDVVVEAVVNVPQEIIRAETILSEVVNETHVAEDKNVKIESNEVQEVVVNSIQIQDLERVETVPYVANSDKNETQNVRSINVENTKAEKADQGKEGPIVIIKSEEKIVVETKGREINLKTEKIDNTRSEKITTERIITERRIQAKEEKPEKVVLNNDKDIKVVNTRESKVVAKKATPEKVQVLNTKPEKEVKDNVLPFKTKENRSNSKNVEIKATKPVVEKTNREAIVMSFNRNTINNTTRNEAPISLEKQTTEESLKAKPLNGHEILLQILGLSQNSAELGNAEPTNSRSVSNINQEEQETKSTKSIPSIYQQRNLNGITLKIAA